MSRVVNEDQPVLRTDPLCGTRQFALVDQLDRPPSTDGQSGPERSGQQRTTRQQ
ncbi:hypothetical protein [Embleya sp. NPDC020630]|uniref:hypothetical protein n=1 Tax=Embleya sp. NPDC020630 TaxID=3363979 RepID=UPI0037A653FA